MRSHVAPLPPPEIARIAGQLAATGIGLSLLNGLVGSVVLFVLSALWHRAAVVIVWVFIGVSALFALSTFVRAVAPFAVIIGAKLIGKVEGESWSALGWYSLGMLARVAEIAVDVGIALWFYHLFS